ncbi:MAG: RsmG family class I SAM-dependent methyltransferase [Candidatus Fermentibacteria bacterium]|nr:RsmG family class I SAM-dependent methyltransferase [Candidatus Fermentibacteria bacterium]
MKHSFPGYYNQARRDCVLLGADLSEESYLKIGRFLDLLVLSAAKTNLVGPSEIHRLWTRHVLESIAFIPFLTDEIVIDIGTGAGFPGMILSLCGYDVVMVESRRKRCAFLETAARKCGVSCRVLNSRIEDAGPFPGNSLFTSRAVKGHEEMVKMIEPAAPAGFSLITRVSRQVETCSNTVISEELPMPPLDRRGFILQYRNPCIKKL